MPRTLYKYNAETCQYERINVKTPDVIFYISGVLVVAILMLAGMLTLHDFIIDSEKEIALRKENNALQKNHSVLTNQLDEIESTLEQLDAKDKALHAKFFGTALEKSTSSAKGVSSKNILLADASTFRKKVNAIEQKSNTLLTSSVITSNYYGEKLTVNKKLAEKISAMPTALPIQPWESDKLVSGFGMRVNPFHKGMYEHPGVDIAATRDTEVFATANGTVTQAKRSDLQAGYGNFVEIDHGHGFITRYAHLGELKIREGQRVRKGAAIGTVGSSGGSIAPHLHYEVIRNGKQVNPVNFMIDGVTSREYSVLRFISEKQNQSLD
jgi:murein DD-endopeptidase MepM/ murein hydrolase activator NlpD